MILARYLALGLFTAPLWLSRLDAVPTASGGLIDASPTIIVRSAAGRIVHSGYQVQGKSMDLWEVDVRLEHEDGTRWSPTRWDCLDFRAGSMRTLLSPDFNGGLKGYALGWGQTLERAAFDVEARTGQTKCASGCPKNWVADRWSWEEAPQGQIGGAGGGVWEGYAKLGELGSSQGPSGVRERSFTIHTDEGSIHGQVGYITDGGALRLDDELAALARHQKGGPTEGFTVVFLGPENGVLGTLTSTPKKKHLFGFLRVKSFDVFDSDVRVLVLKHAAKTGTGSARPDLSAEPAGPKKERAVKRSWLTGPVEN